jgi:DNA-binding PucR family transcriptional regulator
VVQADAQREALAFLERYIAELDEPALTGLARRLAAYAGQGIPELEGLAAGTDLTALARESVRSLFAVLPAEQWRTPDVPVAAMEFTRALVRGGHDLSVLLKVYRLGQVEFWNAVMDVADREIPDPAVRMATLALMWERLSLWVEVVVEHQVQLYEEEREHWLRGALARRSATIRAILAGEDVDPQRAGMLLGHDLGRWQLALTLWADEKASVTDALSRLQALAGELAGAVGAHRPLTMVVGVRGLWAWIGTDVAPDPRVLAGVPALADAVGLRVAAGRPRRGAGGFLDSHREALEAQRVAVAAVDAGPLTTYADVEVVSMLSADETAMRHLVEIELTGLLARDASTARLRQTALAFLRSGSNARAAADLLGTHRNTVLYRVRRAEELLGRPIDDGRLRLELALTLVETFGERLLPPAPSG